MGEDAHSTEQSPLLARPVDDNAAAVQQQPEQRTVRQVIAIAIPCMVALVLIEVSAIVQSIPFSQIMESIICRSMHPDVENPVNNKICKGNDVQSELATITGWGLPFMLVPGILLAVPYGIMADRYGRRIVLCLSIFGICIAQALNIIICWFPETFPLRLIWPASLATVIGGGPRVAVAMLFTMIGDITTIEQRSTGFFYLGASSIFAELISGPLTYWFMKSGDWYTVFVGFVGLCLSTLIPLALPETRDIATLQKHAATESSTPAADDQQGKNFTTKMRTKMGSLCITLTEVTKTFVQDNKKARLLFLSVLFSTLGRDAVILLLQYASKRFNLSWSQTGMLLPVKGSASLLVMMVVLPALSRFLLDRVHLGPLTKDLWILRISVTFLVVGGFSLGLAPTLATFLVSLFIYTLGDGSGLVVRTLITAFVSTNNTGMLYTAISLLESIGFLVAGPIMSQLFGVGLSWGGAWIGLPFLFAGLLFSITWCIVFSVRIQPREDVCRRAEVQTDDIEP